ncbi:hypothetical protein SAMN05444920_104766 [Nonomuraea solani]|uniref:CDP-Glycerol:Poly(Glycerophosphate) glycerophosphotransferase n=1 Tax=Nonomuraea solani TaxID=1144553 RepID=A0A1H6D3S0_9ACTN|nr:hypothetical protein [Nonomuraea solani]SEG79901.1 hypothetical protein SAMN05444920_104766 [Nonomuraea solani]
MPVGPDAPRWVTCHSRRTVLVIVHTVTSGQRLLDVVRLLAADLRVQVVFTIAPDVFSNGVAELLRRIGGVILPWRLAVREPFDLAVCAAYGGIENVHAPLVVIPHGAGYNKLVSRRLGGGAVATLGVYGLSAQELVRDGTVIPSAIVLAHDTERRRLARTCPEAVAVAEVVGDASHDRLIASSHERRAYRRALGVADEHELVVVTSTWGPNSLFGRHAGLLRCMLTELPRDRYRIAALLHPNIWFGHGIWQIRSWLADCLRDELALVPPEADWRGVLIAADHVVGDHGSVAVYGTVCGASVSLVGNVVGDVDPQSAGGLLASTAPRLQLDQPLSAQLRWAAARHHPGQHAEIVQRLTSAPGRFDRNMRRLMYRLMRLPQPLILPRADPVPPPYLISSPDHAACEEGR